MLFILTRELWQTVRHFARKSATQNGIWYWDSDDFGHEMLLHSHDGDKTVASVIKSAVETSRERVSIIIASSVLSEEFEQIVDCVAKYPGNLRISLLLTSRLDELALERCRDFLRRNQYLEQCVSTFVVASRIDSELTPLESEDVVEGFRSLLLLLCGGREPLAESLGLFRAPIDVPFDGFEEEETDELPPFRETGIVAVLGVHSWIPRKQTIIDLTTELLAVLVAAEEKMLAPDIRSRITSPSEVIGRALHLSQSDEPLGVQHFVGEIPPAPESPVECWRVPVSTRRARKERRHLRRVVQQDFANYTASLEAILENVRGWLYQQGEAAFAQAEKAYKSEVFEDAELGSLSYLLREYYPQFDAGKESPENFAEGPTGWPPDESQDCFSDVYEALEEGLEELPSSNTWAKAGAISLALLAAAWVFRDADWFMFFGLVMAAAICPAALWIHRTLKLNELRRQVVQLSDGIYENLQRTFHAELERTLMHTRMNLEYRIRQGATDFSESLREEYESIPLLRTKPEIDWENLQEEILRLRTDLTGVGIDEIRFERLASRMGRLARTIVEAAGGVLPTGAGPAIEARPKELVEEWFDELVGSSVLPLEKVEGLREEILESASAWRMPPLMAPLTDAELHRGYRKVVVVPNSDIIYHHLQESLPRYSGNPVVNLKAWSGPVPGVAICSLMTGLPDTVLETQSMQHHVKERDAV